jgi:hypothetical protein
MNKIIFIVLILLSGCFTQHLYAQNQSEVQIILPEAVDMDEMTDADRDKISYSYTDEQYKNQMFKFINERNYDEIEKISRSKYYSSLLFFRGKKAERYVTASGIKRALDEFRNTLCSRLNFEPDFINEEDYFGECTRHEIWYFQDKEGRNQKLIVQFVEGYITNLLVSVAE